MFTYIITYALIQSSSVIFSIFENMRIEHFKPDLFSIILSGVSASLLWTCINGPDNAITNLSDYYFSIPLIKDLDLQNSYLYNSPLFICLCDIIISNLMMLLVGFYYLEIPSISKLEDKIGDLKDINHDLLINIRSLKRENNHAIVKNQKISALNDDLYKYIDEIHENTSFTIKSLPDHLLNDDYSDSDYNPKYDNIHESESEAEAEVEVETDSDYIDEAKAELNELDKSNKRKFNKALDVYKAKIFDVIRQSKLIGKREITPLFAEISEITFQT